jgi:hypothetical protein
MLSRIDRVLITAHDAAASANRWIELLDAQLVRHDEIAALGARRTTISVGDSEVEFLQPIGPGPVARHLASGGGPFAAGVATHSIHRLRGQLAEAGIVPTHYGDQFFVDGGRLGIPGLNLVISIDVERPRVGLLGNLYEVTHLTDDPAASAARLAKLFSLNAKNFVPIRSDNFGYEGTLTLFDAKALHRIETIHPFDRSKTMGRYFERFGPSLYMCYAETDHLPELRERLKQVAPRDWTGNDTDPNGLFIHPRALSGVMLGVSRTSHAWTWSGHPKRVVPA